jgi:hypothetical protein
MSEGAAGKLTAALRQTLVGERDAGFASRVHTRTRRAKRAANWFGWAARGAAAVLAGCCLEALRQAATIASPLLSGLGVAAASIAVFVLVLVALASQR